MINTIRNPAVILAVLGILTACYTDRISTAAFNSAKHKNPHSTSSHATITEKADSANLSPSENRIVNYITHGQGKGVFRIEEIRGNAVCITCDRIAIKHSIVFKNNAAIYSVDGDIETGLDQFMLLIDEHSDLRTLVKTNLVKRKFLRSGPSRMMLLSTPDSASW
jgi:hypothetical protein